MSPEKKEESTEPHPPAKAGSPKPEAQGLPEGASEDFRYIVRVANTDLDGKRSVVNALTGVRGIGVRMAEVLADAIEVPRMEKIGNLPEAKVAEIEEILANLGEYIPPWIMNRQNDWESGQDLHSFGTDVDLRLRDDLNLLKKIRCYKGIRHEQGQKVRGQRTRSNGRTGLTVGVVKKAAIAAAAEKAKEEGKGKREKKE